MKVWALFSIQNQYDQPENNLEQLFANKPTLEQIKTFFCGDAPFEELDNKWICRYVDLIRGEEVYMDIYGWCRIEDVEVIK